jgi:hypothetical protein
MNKLVSCLVFADSIGGIIAVFTILEAGFWIWDTSTLLSTGFRISDVECGIWDLGCGMQDGGIEV